MKRAWVLPLVLISGVAAAKKPKEPPAPPAPVVGWNQEAGGKFACYHPPAWETLSMGERRMQRQDALNAVMGQWTGGRGDGVTFDSVTATNVETVLLGAPEKIESFIAENLAQCQTSARSGDTKAWFAWLQASPRKLLEGECRRPLSDTLFAYLDVGMDWQFPVGVCKGDPVDITATAMDYYRVDENGPWINAAGDAAKPATGAQYPCTLAGCYAGQLVVRFRGDSGSTVITPVGLHLVYTPPEHGTIDLMVNDTTYYDNVFKVERGIGHRTGITLKPATP